MPIDLSGGGNGGRDPPAVLLKDGPNRALGEQLREVLHAVEEPGYPGDLVTDAWAAELGLRDWYEWKKLDEVRQSTDETLFYRPDQLYYAAGNGILHPSLRAQEGIRVQSHARIHTGMPCGFLPDGGHVRPEWSTESRQSAV